MTTRKSTPALIKRPDDLQLLVQDLRREPIIAVDTESNSLYAYQEQVCLVQFSTSSEDYLVDPLALKDLSVLAPLFNDPAIEKVFHAAEYDLICLHRDFGFAFTNLFDTMIAARILGRVAIGLGSMLGAEFDIQVNKQYQRANWGQRPLPKHLLDYARLDTHYLIPLRNLLVNELHQSDRWPLAREDFDRLSAIKTSNNDQGPSDEKTFNIWRIKGSYDLDPQQAAVLFELCRYRDRTARKINRPLFKVMGDQTLLAIAQDLPGTLNELSHVPGMSQRQIKSHGRNILQAVQRGLNADPVYPPRSPRPDERFLVRLEALRLWRKHTAQDMGVKSDVVLPRDLLFNLAEHNPRQPRELNELMQDVPWRFERFGDQIIRVLSQS